MTPVEFSLTIQGDSLLVKLRGDLDLATVPRLDACLQQMRGDVVVECSGLDFIDSSGLRGFVQGHRAFEARGDRLTIRALPPNARRAFEVAGLTTLLHLE